MLPCLIVEMGRLIKFILGVVMVLLSSSTSFAAVPKGGQEKSPVEIQANVITYDRAANRVTAEGNVVIVRGEVSLRADRVLYNPQTEIAEAIGNVVLVRKEDELKSQRLMVNLRDQTGVVEQGELLIKEDNYIVRGERIEKTGPRTYRISGGSFTTCPCIPPSWRIVSDRATITLGGFGTARGARFYIRGLPILYIPYFFFPVVTERSTGFLIPTPGFSNREGFKLNLPFFWAISRSSDLTLGLDYRSRRGPRPYLEYRYVLSRDSFGSFSVDFIEDNLTKQTRYSIKSDHQQLFDPRFFLKSKVRFVNQVTQLAEFEEPIELRAARQLESTALLVRSLSDFNFVGESSYIIDLAQARTSTVPQPVPRLTLSRMMDDLFGTPFHYRFDVQFANFSRGRGDSGLRLDLDPSLTLPMKLGGRIELSPKVGFRETLYQLRGGRDLSRDLFQFSTHLSTELERIYRLGSSRLRHSLEPAIVYELVPRQNQGRFPFFDPIDRIQQGQALSFLLTNRIFFKNLSTGEIFQLAWFRLSQELALGPIDFNVPERPFPSLRAQLLITPPRNFILDMDSRFDTRQGELSSFDTHLNLGGGLLTVGYRFIRGLSEELDASTTIRPLKGLSLSYLARYSIRESLFLESSFGVGYVSCEGCWSVSFNITDRVRPNRTDFKLIVDLRGLGTLGR